MPPDDQAQAIGRLEGEVKHIAQDLAKGRDRIHELAQATQRVTTKLDTLIETGVPQRERMIDELAKIKNSVAPLPDLIDTVMAHGKILKDHEAARNQAKGVLVAVGAGAGFVSALAVKALSAMGWIR